MILLITVVFYITNIFLFIDLTIWGTYFFDRFFIIWFSLGYNLFLIRFYVSIGEKDDMMIENYWTNLTLFREINLITLYFFLSLLINIYSNQLSEYILAGLLGFIGFYFSFISTNKEIEKARKMSLLIALMLYNIVCDKMGESQLFAIIMLYIYFGFILKFIYENFIFKVCLWSKQNKFVSKIFTYVISVLFHINSLKNTTKVFYVAITLFLPYFTLKYFLGLSAAIIYVLLLYHSIILIIMVYNLIISDFEFSYRILNNIVVEQQKEILKKLYKLILYEKEMKTKKIGYYVLIVTEKALDENSDIAEDLYLIGNIKEEIEFKNYRSSYYNILIALTPGILNATIVQILI